MKIGGTIRVEIKKPFVPMKITSETTIDEVYEYAKEQATVEYEDKIYNGEVT